MAFKWLFNFSTVYVHINLCIKTLFLMLDAILTIIVMKY